MNFYNYPGARDPHRDLITSEYVAGSRFTIADITLLTAVDFAVALVDLKPAESIENLWLWHQRVSSRQSTRV